MLYAQRARDRDGVARDAHRATPPEGERSDGLRDA